MSVDRLMHGGMLGGQVAAGGTWVNELGSRMEVETDGATLQGRYWTAVGSPGGDVPFPLTGYTAGNLVAFVVDFGKFGSLTAWVGEHRDDPERLETHWSLVKNTPDSRQPDTHWADTLTGCNVFTRPSA